MEKRIYRVDNFFYLGESDNNCLLIESDLEPHVLAKIIVAVQFKFEELVDETKDIELAHLLDILERFYNVKNVKEKYKHIIEQTGYLAQETECLGSEYSKFTYIFKFNIDQVEVIKIDISSARKEYCAPNYTDLYEYLVKDKELDNIISNYRNYPKEYKDYIERLDEDLENIKIKGYQYNLYGNFNTPDGRCFSIDVCIPTLYKLYYRAVGCKAYLRFKKVAGHIVLLICSKKNKKGEVIEVIEWEDWWRYKIAEMKPEAYELGYVDGATDFIPNSTNWDELFNVKNLSNDWFEYVQGLSYHITPVLDIKKEYDDMYIPEFDNRNER
ncbi:MAG: hypothetical protein E6538_14050 [Paeniclostridium sordellii]|nr:hypothetical protein [Paeniclostridium sordellii]